MRHTQVSETQENLPLQMTRPTPHNILLDFEHLLSSMLREVGLIGEIPLSDDDESLIEAALRELLRFSEPGKATQFLQEEVPCMLACWLVWKGTRGYHEGDYWTEVRQAVGLFQAKTNWSDRLGKIFEDVLQRFHLPDFRGGHRFVTPILLHEGEWIDTDSPDLDLGAPGKQYEVTLFSGEKPLRRWMIPGISYGWGLQTPPAGGGTLSYQSERTRTHSLKKCSSVPMSCGPI